MVEGRIQYGRVLGGFIFIPFASCLEEGRAKNTLSQRGKSEQKGRGGETLLYYRFDLAETIALSLLPEQVRQCQTSNE